MYYFIQLTNYLPISRLLILRVKLLFFFFFFQAIHLTTVEFVMMNMTIQSKGVTILLFYSLFKKGLIYLLIQWNKCLGEYFFSVVRM